MSRRGLRSCGRDTAVPPALLAERAELLAKARQAARRACDGSSAPRGQAAGAAPRQA